MKTVDLSTIKDWTKYEIRPKLNGIFAEWDGQNLRTKTGNIVPSVEHITPDCPIGTQGELYCHGLSFQCLNGMIMTTQKKAPDKIKFYPHLDIKPVFVFSLDGFNGAYNGFLRKGYEGVVLRDRDTGEMFKHKPRPDMEAVIIGFNPGTGKNADLFGSLRLQTESGEKFNCSGITDHARRRLWKEQAIGATVTVSYSYLTERGVPVSPSFIDYRFDEPIKTHGGKRPGSGRKPKKSTERRSIKRMYRFTEDEYQKITEGADRLSMSEADFVRHAINSFLVTDEGGL